MREGALDALLWLLHEDAGSEEPEVGRALRALLKLLRNSDAAERFMGGGSYNEVYHVLQRFAASPDVQRGGLGVLWTLARSERTHARELRSTGAALAASEAAARFARERSVRGWANTLLATLRDE